MPANATRSRVQIFGSFWVRTSGQLSPVILSQRLPFNAVTPTPGRVGHERFRALRYALGRSDGGRGRGGAQLRLSTNMATEVWTRGNTGSRCMTQSLNATKYASREGHQVVEQIAGAGRCSLRTSSRAVLRARRRAPAPRGAGWSYRGGEDLLRRRYSSPNSIPSMSSSE